LTACMHVEHVGAYKKFLDHHMRLVSPYFFVWKPPGPFVSLLSNRDSKLGHASSRNFKMSQRNFASHWRSHSIRGRFLIHNSHNLWWVFYLMIQEGIAGCLHLTSNLFCSWDSCSSKAGFWANLKCSKLRACHKLKRLLICRKWSSCQHTSSN
jgi:hypothetical protein